MNLDELIDEQLNNEKYREPINLQSKAADNLIKNIEAEYTGYDSIVLSRKAEIKDIDGKITALKRTLNSLKNPKGMNGSATKRAQNTTTLNTKRDQLRKEIATLNFKLEEIRAEGGEDVTGKSMMAELMEKNKNQKNNHIIEIRTKPDPISVETKSSTINLGANPYLDI